MLPAGYLPGMYETLWAQGIQTEGGVSGEFASDPVMAQAIINTYTPAKALAFAQQAKCAEVDTLAAKLRNQIVAGTSPAEMSSWPLKLMQAQAYLAGTDTAPALLSAESQSRGVTLQDLAQRVITNNAQLGALEAQIAGTSGKHRDTIAALTDLAAVEAYNYSTGWPEV